MSLTLVGVYGSLRQGFGNHPLLRDSEYIKTSTMLMPFQMVSVGAFPALVPYDALRPVVLEFYWVNGDVFADLDILEGYPDFYDRTQFKVEEGMAWVYHFPNNSLWRYNEVVDSGDWRVYCDNLMGA